MTASPAGENHDLDRDHPRDREHRGGLVGLLRVVFVPQTHDASDSVDDALEASERGIRALKVSLWVLLVTTALQLVVVLFSSSVALLAGTVHNFSDALTAVPLWIAFILGRRAPTRRYPYGYGRAKDLAGLFIVAWLDAVHHSTCDAANRSDQEHIDGRGVSRTEVG